MAFTVPENVNVETAHGEVIQALRRLRRIPAGRENDFELSSPDFLSNLWNQLTGALVILTTVISFDRAAGGRHRRNEHHAHLRDRAHPGNWRAQSHRRAAARMSVLQFFAGSRGAHLVGGSIGIVTGAGVSILVRNTRAFDSRDIVVSVGLDWVCDLRRRGGCSSDTIGESGLLTLTPSFACGTNEDRGVVLRPISTLELKAAQKWAKNGAFQK